MHDEQDDMLICMELWRRAQNLSFVSVSQWGVMKGNVSMRDELPLDDDIGEVSGET